MPLDDTLSVKAFFNEEVRRFGIPDVGAFNFAGFMTKVKNIFSITENFNITWQDVEGDNIIISSDEELGEAIAEVRRTNSQSLLKVYVRLTNGQKENKNQVPQNEGGPNFNGKQHFCNGCNIDIIGLRFKCLECVSYYLCISCKQKGLHAHHKMTAISSATTTTFSSGPSQPLYAGIHIPPPQMIPPFHPHCNLLGTPLLSRGGMSANGMPFGAPGSVPVNGMPFGAPGGVPVNGMPFGAPGGAPVNGMPFVAQGGVSVNGMPFQPFQPFQPFNQGHSQRGASSNGCNGNKGKGAEEAAQSACNFAHQMASQHAADIMKGMWTAWAGNNGTSTDASTSTTSASASKSTGTSASASASASSSPSSTQANGGNDTHSSGDAASLPNAEKVNQNGGMGAPVAQLLHDDFMQNLGHNVAQIFDPFGIDIQAAVKNLGLHQRRSSNVESAEKKSKAGTPEPESMQVDETLPANTPRNTDETEVKSGKNSEGTSDAEETWTVVNKESSPEKASEEVNQKFKRALEVLNNMGYKDDGGWLMNIIKMKDGDINQILDLLHPSK